MRHITDMKYSELIFKCHKWILLMVINNLAGSLLGPGQTICVHIGTILTK